MSDKITVPQLAHRCPFCGSGDLILIEGVMEDSCFFVTCLDCCSCGPTAEVPEMAYDRWQSRSGLGEVCNLFSPVENH